MDTDNGNRKARLLLHRVGTCFGLLLLGLLCLSPVAARSGLPDSLRMKRVIPLTDSTGVKIAYPFPAVLVIQDRKTRESFAQPRSLSTLQNDQFRERNLFSLPDILSESPGVLVQKTNTGGGSPFLRGFTGKQILILIDGIRLNNSCYRFGPNQYLHTVNPFVADHVEIVAGPASAEHGSDALGGIVHIKTQYPSLEQKARLQLYQRLASADRSSVSHLQYQQGWQRWALLTGISYKSSGNLRAGQNGESPVGAIDVDGRQPHTGFAELSANLALTYVLSSSQRLNLCYLFTHQSDVPRSDKLIRTEYNPVPEQMYFYDPQILQLGYLEYQAVNLSFLDRFTMQVGVNHQQEGRRRRKAGWNKTRFEEDDVFTSFARLQVSQNLSPLHTIDLGFDAYDDQIHSSRHEIADASDDRISKTGRFPDDSRYRGWRLYCKDEFREAEIWTLRGGISVGASQADFDLSEVELDTIFGTDGEAVSFQTDRRTATFPNWSLNLESMLSLSPGLRIFGRLARGYRAPNMDDLAVEGDWSSGTDIPNPQLRPESLWQLELGAKWKNERMQGSLALFQSWYSDFIQRRYLGYRLGSVGDTISVYQFANISEGILRGVDWTNSFVNWQLGRYTGCLDAQASWIWGQNLSDDAPMRRIPPLMLRLGMRLEASQSQHWFEFFIQGAGRQDRLSPGDRADIRIPDDGTPGWLTLNLRGALRISSHLKLDLGFYNLLDARYRVHGSGIDGAGRNAVIGLSIQ